MRIGLGIGLPGNSGAGPGSGQTINTLLLNGQPILLSGQAINKGG